jgi:histidine triad (HIT) family protein
MDSLAGGARVPDGNCPFCRIAAGELPATIVYQDDSVVAFRDIAPRAPTHILVVPRRHVPSLLDLAESDGALLGRIFATAADIARSEGIAERGFRVVANCGPWAGQSVGHLHFHLLGGRTMSWPPG